MEIFNETFMPEGHADVWLATRSCPACLAGWLRPITTTAGAAHWVCEDCGRCWEALRSHLRSVDPISCAGCATRNQRDCITLLQANFPRFGLDAAPSDD